MKNKIDLNKDKFKPGHKVPNGYFKNLEESILSQTIGQSSQPIQEIKKVKMNPWYLRSGAIAASVVLFLGLYLVFARPNKPPMELASVSTTELFESEDLEISQDDFLSLVSMEDLNSMHNEIKENAINNDDEFMEEYENYEI